MNSRRREARFVTTPAWTGVLQTGVDVVIERVTATELWVVSPSAARCGETMTLQVAGQDHAVVTLRVRVSASVPAVVEDRLQHRLRLRLLESPDTSVR